MQRLLPLSVLALTAFAPSQAKVQLPNVFGHNMVLQRGRTVPVWGTAAAGENITVSFAGQSVATTANDQGRWRIDLQPLTANSSGQQLTIAGAQSKVAFTNVLVGEVWIASGQSNMEWAVRRCAQPEKERKAAKYPGIRHIKVPRVHTGVPQTNFNGNWTVCSPGTVANYTAVGYYFARRLHRELGVPIGIINTSWGGTRIEPWTPLEGFQSVAKQGFAKPIIKRIQDASPTSEQGRKQYAIALAAFKKWVAESEARVAKGTYPKTPPRMPGLGGNHQSATRLYRGMVHPLVPYAFRGAIWYQGESNGSESMSYYHKMHGLVNGWRQVWNQGDFPFYFVQLANFRQDKLTPEGGDGYAKVRDAQRKAQDLTNSGMAVIIDIGETRDIHPKNKQDVGSRLAQWALARDYGKDIVPCGPLYKSHAVEGGKIRIHFDHVGKGLMVGKKKGLAPTQATPDAPLARFAICGKDRKWVWAKAVIDGATVVVSHKDVKEPIAVRYAFSDNPLGANLYNMEGLPASPFRTDAWE